MKQVVVGLLAHVDAGKTTLAEAMLYATGAIRTRGRVDRGDAHLDFDPIERDRGITVYAKQAVVTYDDLRITLLDTPGHVDFSAEAERTLQVLDLAILVVGANDGVQGHTKTLWNLLARHGVPTVLFVNKMDLAGYTRAQILEMLCARLDDACFDVASVHDADVQERLALTDDAALEEFFGEGELSDATVRALVTSRKAFPCVFGSALRGDGVEELFRTVESCAPAQEWPSELRGRVFKVTHGVHGEREAWVKVTGGVLRAKSQVEGHTATGAEWSGKIDQVRLYQGARFEIAREVAAGGVCAVTGLPDVLPGDALGEEAPGRAPVLMPVLDYRVIPCGCDAHEVHQALRELCDEDPLLGVEWNEELQEVRVQLMGSIQQEIVQSRLRDRFGIQVEFGPGSVLYKETIEAPADGVGHFEPLRHYAEVHVRLEPGERGSGVAGSSECSEDELARNWQRLILTHVYERTHRGVLTGAPLTDVRVVLTAGRAHAKHTEGGDFRQATYRAIRQALMGARSVLLEPWYRFCLEVPAGKVGRALSDLQRMYARFDPPVVDGDEARVEGFAPVCEMRDYALQVSAYTGGLGHLSLEFGGYEPCHNAEEVIGVTDYDPEADLAHTPDSVFCSHGAGYTVKWYDVPAMAHVQPKASSGRG